MRRMASRSIPSARRVSWLPNAVERDAAARTMLSATLRWVAGSSLAQIKVSWINAPQRRWIVVVLDEVAHVVADLRALRHARSRTADGPRLEPPQRLVELVPVVRKLQSHLPGSA